VFLWYIIFAGGCGRVRVQHYTILEGDSGTIFDVIYRRTLILGSVGALALVGGVAALETSFQNRILPGVQAGGIPVSGLRLEEAEARLQTKLKGRAPQVRVKLGLNTFDVPASDFGWQPDATRTAQAAMLIGRRGNLFTRLQDRLSALGGRVRLPLQATADRDAVRQRLLEIIEPVTTLPVDARMVVQGGRFHVIDERVGRGVDLDAAVGAYLKNPNRTALNLNVTTLPARITSKTLLPIAAQTNTLLRGIKLNYTEPNGTVHVVTLTPTEIAGFLKPEGTKFNVDPDAVQARLRRIGLGFDRAPQDARYVRAGAELKIRGDAPGWKLDLETAKQVLTDEIVRPESTEVLLPIIASQPKISAATLPKVDNLNLLAESFTSYAGSSRERVINVAVAASKLDGYVVPAGETFSFNQAVGPIEPEQGFAEGYVISGGRTIKGVGGGVCQASTTTFRALYKAGLPIIERNQHAYRVRWYDPLVGLDAAVYQPYLDMRMQNNTPGPLVVRASTSGASMTVRLYGVSDGRKVNVSGPAILSHTPAPAPKTEFDPNLRFGERKQVDWAADGYRVNITRTINGDAEVLASRYKAWQAVYAYGPTARPRVQRRAAPARIAPRPRPVGVTITPAVAPTVVRPVATPSAPGRITPPER
jgi:vancomycin resistance protein YoaR